MASSAAARRPVWSRTASQRYFAGASLSLLVSTLIGFSDNLVTNVGQPSNSDPKFIVHGLFCLAWMIVLVAQSWLVRHGKMALHRTLGMASAFIAVGVTLSTLYVFWVVWKSWSLMDFEVRANRILMPAYALFVLLGYVQRKRPDRHKRFMLLASFFMLGPILARCFDPVLAPILPYFAEETVDTMFIVYFFSLWSACFLSLLVLDWMTLRRLHGISLAGTGVFCGTWTTAFLS